MLVMPTGWELTTKVRTNTQVCMAHDTATKVHRQPRMFPIVRLSSPRGCAIRRAALAAPIVRPTPLKRSSAKDRVAHAMQGLSLGKPSADNCICRFRWWATA